MKNFKKKLAVLLAFVMVVLAAVPAYAAPGDFLTTTIPVTFKAAEGEDALTGLEGKTIDFNYKNVESQDKTVTSEPIAESEGSFTTNLVLDSGKGVFVRQISKDTIVYSDGTEYAVADVNLRSTGFLSLSYSLEVTLGKTVSQRVYVKNIDATDYANLRNFKVSYADENTKTYASNAGVEVVIFPYVDLYFYPAAGMDTLKAEGFTAVSEIANIPVSYTVNSYGQTPLKNWGIWLGQIKSIPVEFKVSGLDFRDSCELSCEAANEETVTATDGGLLSDPTITFTFPVDISSLWNLLKGITVVSETDDYVVDGITFVNKNIAGEIITGDETPAIIEPTINLVKSQDVTFDVDEMEDGTVIRFKRSLLSVAQNKTVTEGKVTFNLSANDINSLRKEGDITSYFSTTGYTITDIEIDGGLKTGTIYAEAEVYDVFFYDYNKEEVASTSVAFGNAIEGAPDADELSLPKGATLIGWTQNPNARSIQLFNMDKITAEYPNGIKLYPVIANGQKLIYTNAITNATLEFILSEAGATVSECLTNEDFEKIDEFRKDFDYEGFSYKFSKFEYAGGSALNEIVVLDGPDMNVQVCFDKYCAITFDVDGAQATGYAKVGELVILPDGLSTAKTGHNFEGWLISGTDDQYFDLESDLASEAMTLVAQFSPKTYTITVDYGFGDAKPSFEQTYGVALGNELLSNAMVAGFREGYTFVNWTINNEVVTVGSQWTTDSDCTIVANWSKNSTGGGGSTGGSGGSAKSAQPAGTVTGNWQYIATSDKWTFTSTEGKVYHNEWVNVYNPYATGNQPKASWYFFDANGIMLTGYQWIPSAAGGFRLFYFHEANDGDRGRMYANAATPNGGYADQTGWVYINGVLQVK